MTKADVQKAFADQARHCANLGSPFMAQLCTLFATRDWPDGALTDRIMAWKGDLGPSNQAVPLRLCGGLHALVLQQHALADAYPPAEVDDDKLWTAISHALVDSDCFLDHWIDSPPQTNEVRRASAVIATAMVVADRFPLPFRITELGASGGLNLMWDRFALTAGGMTFGERNSSIHLTPDWTGKPPPHSIPTIVERRGVDLNPLEPRNGDDALRLQAYLWPDQPDRMVRTQAAIAINEATVDRSDAIDWLEPRLAHQAGTLHFIYHTIAWQYFPPDKQARGRAMIEAAGAKATINSPLAWAAMEGDNNTKGAALTLRLWPGAETLHLGRADFHGRWIDWTHS